jgi:hypothetical protein
MHARWQRDIVAQAIRDAAAFVAVIICAGERPAAGQGLGGEVRLKTWLIGHGVGGGACAYMCIILSLPLNKKPSGFTGG